jgi:hypothetical protein
LEFGYNGGVKTRWLIGVLLVASLAVGTWIPAHAQILNSEYFPQTGHNLKGDFLAFYRSIKDPEVLYGYPITEAILINGRLVQYFQRARFEFYPERPAGQRVVQTRIGTETYVPGAQLIIDNPFACQNFGTAYPVCFTFLDFYLSHGGVAQFGKPISPFEYRENLIVQYFENARFEWKPSMAEGQRVSIADLGKIYFNFKGEDPNLLRAVPNEQTGKRVLLSLQVRAFAWKAVTLSTDQQLIFVVVQDQTLQPVSGATGTATIRWPNGQTETLAFLSNSSGVGLVPLSINNQPYGNLVFVDITVTKDGLTAPTTTSFRIWY